MDNNQRVSVHSPDYNGTTPQMEAASNGNVKGCHMLLCKNATANHCLVKTAFDASMNNLLVLSTKKLIHLEVNEDAYKERHVNTY